MDEKQERNRLIAQIEPLYPPDCEYPDTCAIGRQLLVQAQEEAKNWRDEPLPILRRFAQLCIEEERNPVLTRRLYATPRTPTVAHRTSR
jgi:hypothetical protein